ncbi:MAG: hypothetical protein LBH98_00460 [Chitinispirillales bacterium]|jgi:hypothetical protein|nr:hypothetical protein [Chitinispirillales bacterium]
MNKTEDLVHKLIQNRVRIDAIFSNTLISNIKSVVPLNQDGTLSFDIKDQDRVNLFTGLPVHSAQTRLSENEVAYYHENGLEGYYLDEVIKK